MLGQRLRVARALKGYTIAELSEMSDVSHTTICRCENDIGAPNIRTISKLSKFLDVSVTWLTDESELKLD